MHNFYSLSSRSIQPNGDKRSLNYKCITIVQRPWFSSSEDYTFLSSELNMLNSFCSVC